MQFNKISKNFALEELSPNYCKYIRCTGSSLYIFGKDQIFACKNISKLIRTNDESFNYRLHFKEYSVSDEIQQKCELNTEIKIKNFVCRKEYNIAIDEKNYFYIFSMDFDLLHSVEKEDILSYQFVGNSLYLLMRDKVLSVKFSDSGDIEDASSHDIPSSISNIQVTLEENVGHDSKLAIQRKSKVKNIEAECLRLFNNYFSEKLIVLSQYPYINFHKNSTLDETPQEFSFSQRDEDSVMERKNDFFNSRRDSNEHTNTRTFIKKVNSKLVSQETSKAQPITIASSRANSNQNQDINTKSLSERITAKRKNIKCDENETKRQGFDDLLSQLGKSKKDPKSDESENQKNSFTMSLNSSIHAEVGPKSSIAKEFSNLLESFNPLKKKSGKEVAKNSSSSQSSGPTNKNKKRIDSLKSKYAKVFEKLDGKEVVQSGNNKDSKEKVKGTSTLNEYFNRESKKVLGESKSNSRIETLKTHETVGFQYLEDNIENIAKPSSFRYSLRDKENDTEKQYHNFSFISKPFANSINEQSEEIINPEDYEVFEEFACTDPNEIDNENEIEDNYSGTFQEEEKLECQNIQGEEYGIFDKIFVSLKELHGNKGNVNHKTENIKIEEEEIDISDFEINMNEEADQKSEIKKIKISKQVLIIKEAQLLLIQQKKNFTRFKNNIRYLKGGKMSKTLHKFKAFMPFLTRILKLKLLSFSFYRIKCQGNFINNLRYTPTRLDNRDNNQYFSGSPVVFSCKVNCSSPIKVEENMATTRFYKERGLFEIKEMREEEVDMNSNCYLMPLLLIDNAFRKIVKKIFLEKLVSFRNLSKNIEKPKFYQSKFETPQAKPFSRNHFTFESHKKESNVLIKFSGGIDKRKSRSQSPISSSKFTYRNPLISMSGKKEMSVQVRKFRSFSIPSEREDSIKKLYRIFDRRILEQTSSALRKISLYSRFQRNLRNSK